MSQLACFGSIVMHDGESEFCRACHCEPKCAQAAYENGIEVQRQIDISQKLSQYTSRPDIELKTKPESRRYTHTSKRGRKQFEPIKPSVQQQDQINGLPKKAQHVVKQCLKRGIDVSGDLKSNLNPFRHSSAYLRVAGELASKGAFTRMELVDAIKEAEPYWTHKTAVSHAYIALNALSVYGVCLNNTGEYYERGNE